MKRKLMRMGPSSIVVSLPADWVRRFELKDKEEIDVQEVGDHLQIGVQEKASHKSAVFDISKFSHLALRALGVLYKTGYSNFSIKYDEGKKRFRDHVREDINLIKNSLDSYTGIDLVDIKNTKKGNFVIAEQKAQILPEEFDRSLNQSFLDLKMMASEIYESIRKGDDTRKDEISLMDNLINQTTNFCIRILAERGYSEYQKSIFVYSLVERIEQIGDIYRDIYYNFIKNKEISKVVMGIFNKTITLLDLFYHTYCKFTIERANKCAVDAHVIFDAIDGIVEKNAQAIDFKVLFSLYDVTSRIWDSLEPLMAINHEALLETN